MTKSQYSTVLEDWSHRTSLETGLFLMTCTLNSGHTDRGDPGRWGGKPRNFSVIEMKRRSSSLVCRRMFFKIMISIFEVPFGGWDGWETSRGSGIRVPKLGVRSCKSGNLMDFNGNKFN